MNFIDRAVAFISPQRGAARAQARAMIMHFDAATVGRRGSSFRASATDADAAGAKRERMAFISRDMVRNNPFALSGQQVIANNVVGDGIIPKIEVPDTVADSANLKKQGLKLIETFLDTTAIDADGVQNFYGLQRLAMNTIVDAGEVLIIREQSAAPRPGKFGLRLRVLEPDYLDNLHDGVLPGGGSIHDGIEYDARGRRVAYYLYDQHPGTDWFRGVGWRSRSTRVPADRVLHVYRQDRPGQMRGVTWFAPIALALQDLDDYRDAQQMRQKIAACFAVFRRRSEQIAAKDVPDLGGTLGPGLIQDIASDEEIFSAAPPDVGGYDQVMRTGLLACAAGLGITYEEFVGDLLNVNFSSGRMGRMKMDRNVSSWQWLMMIPQMLHPIGDWICEEWALMSPENARDISRCTLAWVPPHRPLVDPTREIPALVAKVRGGLASRQGTVRSLGYDPERLLEEQAQDAKDAAALNLVFDSDPAAVTASGVTQGPPPEDDEGGSNTPNDKGGETDE